MDDGSGAPRGCLAPIPGVGGFDTKTEAVRYMRNNPDAFKGMQVLIFRGLEMGAPKVTQTVELAFKPRRLIRE